VILPNKHLRQDRAILSVGTKILSELQEPLTVSELWNRVKGRHARGEGMTTLTFDWFILTLTFLFSVHAIQNSGGVLRVAKK